MVLLGRRMHGQRVGRFPQPLAYRINIHDVSNPLDNTYRAG